jgi:diaminopimelate decarboxylase
MINLLPLESKLEENGSLSIGRHSVRELARKWGTPLYIYDAHDFYKRVDGVRALLKQSYAGQAEISYAGKTYLSLNFAKILNEHGLTLDTVSLGEMMIARKAGFSPAKVHLNGNNKTRAELEYALEWGIDSIVVDSPDELEFLTGIARETNRVANIWLRITPGVEVDTHPFIQTAYPASKFGFPIEDGQASRGIQSARANPWVNLKGLHMHIGSQLFDPTPYLQALRSLFQLAESENLPLGEISPGGGWGVPYVTSEKEVDLPALISAIGETITAECARLGWELPRLVVEPGRFLIARAGLSVYEIGTIKQSSDGTRFAAVDGGMSDNPRPALYDSKYAALVLDKPLTPTAQRYKVVGKLCESGDRLITSALLPDIQRGDLLVIPVSGAYQLSMSSNYNLMNRPAVLWLEEDEVRVLQKRENIEEMKWWLGE